MKFTPHSELQGRHASLSASKHHWLGYDDAKLKQTFHSNIQAQRGTDLHALAAEDIRLGMKRPKNRMTFNEYVNDAIGFRMSPEIVLFVSYNAFGTTDCIGFREEVVDKETGEMMWVLRIHDLKTGSTRTSFRQLMVYAAYFCIEYKKDPHEMMIVLRIYQNDEVKQEQPHPAEIQEIMDKTLHADRLYEAYRLEVAQ